MNDTFNSLATELESLERLVRRTTARHINTKATKEKVKSFVHAYFSDLRPTLAKLVGEHESLGRLDDEIQELLRCAQRRALVADYCTVLKLVEEALHDVELRAVDPRSLNRAGPSVEPKQQRILDVLGKVCPSAALSYEQALCDLSDTTRKSWRGTAVEFREALREALDKLAPDEEVEKQIGFGLEPNTDKPTMKQKAVFILRSRRQKDLHIKTFANAVDVVEESIGKFVRSVYTRSSLAVHVADSIDEAKQIRDYVSLVLAELLEIRD